MNAQNDQMAAAALRLLEDPVQRVLELKRVMAAHPTLTQMGFAWHMPRRQASHSREFRHRMPEGDVELEEYERQRDELRHESLTLEECILANGPEPGSPRAAAQSTPGSLRGCGGDAPGTSRNRTPGPDPPGPLLPDALYGIPNRKRG